MISKEFNDWLQVAGLFSVLGGLIFVGLQLKQSQDIAIASQYTERSSAAREYWNMMAEHPELRSQSGENHRDHMKALRIYRDDWTDEEVGLWYLLARNLLINWDNNLYQYESGFMTEEGWEQYEIQMRIGCVSGSLAHTVVTNHREGYRQALIDYCLKFAGE